METSNNSKFSVVATRWPLLHQGRSWPNPIFRGALLLFQEIAGTNPILCRGWRITWFFRIALKERLNDFNLHNFLSLVETAMWTNVVRPFDLVTLGTFSVSRNTQAIV